MFVLRQVNGVCDDEGYGCTRREQKVRVEMGRNSVGRID